MPRDLKIVFAPALIFLSFIAFGKVLTVVAHLIRFRAHGIAFYFMYITQAYCTAALLAVLFCYPVALLYQRSGIVMASAMALPASCFYLANALSPSVPGSAAVITLYSLFAYVTLLVYGTWLAHEHLQRSNVTLERVKGWWGSAADGR
jgi:hypothetical protein